MRSRLLIAVFFAFLAAFAAALWWFQTHAYYGAVEDVTEIEVAGAVVPVEDWNGIDADTSPLKLRGCFRLPEGAPPAAIERAEALGPGEATPLVAPGWFECFDAAEIEQGLAEGGFRALLGERNAPWGFDRIVALDPQTRRGWTWRQLNSCGQAKFDGDPLPEGCGAPPEG